MRAAENTNDGLTTAAVGLCAMCIVTFDHEALGHGSVCILLHGHILLLSSSLFRCAVRSGWIDPAGPFCNLLVGMIALVCLRFVPERRLAFRLLLIAITAFSYFWEAGYVIRAMIKRDGDLYFFAQFLSGDVPIWLRCAAAGAGFALYVFTVRLTANALLKLWPEASAARAVARTLWMSATAGAAVAAFAYSGPGWGDLKDAVLEIGGASFPLLFIPRRSRQPEQTQQPAFLARSTTTIVLVMVIYGLFVASLGRGMAF